MTSQDSQKTAAIRKESESSFFDQDINSLSTIWNLYILQGSSPK